MSYHSTVEDDKGGGERLEIVDHLTLSESGAGEIASELSPPLGLMKDHSYDGYYYIVRWGDGPGTMEEKNERIYSNAHDCELVYFTSGSGDLEWLREAIDELEEDTSGRLSGVDYRIEAFGCDCYDTEGHHD